MDYTPINARRVRFAIGLTLIIALSPVAFCLLDAVTTKTSALFGMEAADGYRVVALLVGSVLLAAAVAGVGIGAVRLGQRVVRRPLRA